MNISTQTDSQAFTTEVSIQTGCDQDSKHVIGKWKGFDPAVEDWYCDQEVDVGYQCGTTNYNGTTHCYNCHHKRVFTAEEQEQLRKNDLINQEKGYYTVFFGEYNMDNHNFAEFLRQYREGVTQIVSINSHQYLLAAFKTADQEEYHLPDMSLEDITKKVLSEQLGII